MLHVFVDGDACPVKNEVYKVAGRFKLNVTVVANSWMRIPDDPSIQLDVVGGNLDEADDWIVEHVQANDIVITSDVLLADRCVKKEARVIGATGKSFTEESIGSTVAMRNLMTDLRDAGELMGGSPPFTKKDRSNFLQELNRVIELVKREC